MRKIVRAVFEILKKAWPYWIFTKIYYNLLQFTTIYYKLLKISKTRFFLRKPVLRSFRKVLKEWFLKLWASSLERISRLCKRRDPSGCSPKFTTIYYNLLQFTTIPGAGAVKKCAGSKNFPKIIFSMIMWWTLPICRSPECLELFLRPRRRPSAKSGCPGRLPPGPGGSQEASPIKSNNL